MYVETGAVRLSVLSRAGKEAVIAVIDAGHFLGEGCLASQTQRIATPSAMSTACVKVIEKQDMVRHLHARPAFADRFLTHMLTRNIRIEEDPIASEAAPRPPCDDLDADLPFTVDLRRREEAHDIAC